MLLIGHLGCQLLLWLGLVESVACDEWVEDSGAESEAASTSSPSSAPSVQWFKLLFVPTLGLVILTLFVLEEHCYGHGEAKRRREEEAQQKSARPTAGGRLQPHRATPHRAHSPEHQLLHHSIDAGRGSRGRSASAASHSHHLDDECGGVCCERPSDVYHLYTAGPSPSRRSSTSSSSRRPLSFSLSSAPPPRSSSPSATPHILFVSESNQPTAYTLPPSLPLRELICFHSSRHNLTLDPVLVYVDGRLIDAAHYSDPCERLGVRDGSVVRVEMDWRRMVEVMMKEEEREGKDMERELTKLRRDRVEKQERAHKMDAERSALQVDVDRERRQAEEAEVEREEVVRLMRAAEERLRQASGARSAVEELKRVRERESGSEREKREAMRLEESMAAMRKETSELNRERGELGAKTRRVKEEAEELAGKRRELGIRGDRIEREKEGWKRKVETGERAVLERLERAEKEREESGRMKAKMESSEREKDEKRQSKEEAHRSIVQRIEQLDQAIAKRTARLRAAEKEAAETSKFRQLAKAYEADLKESARWKLLVKQGRVREKLLEKETKDLVHWRQRAKAFEREVRQLRSWRREVGRRERRAEGVEGVVWGANGRMMGVDYAGDGLMDGLGYDAPDEWKGDSVAGLSSDDLALHSADIDDDEAAIPPVDVITSQALSASTASSLSSSSRSSFAVTSSTLQPTAPPFVPRLSLPLAVHPPTLPITSTFTPPPTTSLYPSYPGWSATGGPSTPALLIIDDRSPASSTSSATSAASFASSGPFPMGGAGLRRGSVDALAMGGEAPAETERGGSLSTR